MSETLAWLWATMLSFPQRPLVQLLLIPLAAWVFHRGVMQVQRHQHDESRRLREHTDAALSEIKSAIKDSAKLPTLLALQGQAMERAISADRNITEIAMLADRVTAFASAPAQTAGAPANPAQSQTLVMHIDSLRRTLPDIGPPPERVFPIPVVRMVNGDTSSLPEDNEAYYASILRYAADLNHWLHAARSSMATLHQEETELRGQVQIERNRLNGI